MLRLERFPRNRPDGPSATPWDISRGCLANGLPPECRMRKVDELFERYGESHRNRTNEAIHWICVPLITWSVLAALWAAAPVVAYIGIAVAVAFYAWLSVQIAVGMLALF